MNDQVEDMENVLADIAVRLMSLENTVSEQDSEINRLQRVIDLKDKTIHDLENRLSKYEDPPKDSHNSSIPPTRIQLKIKLSATLKLFARKTVENQVDNLDTKGILLRSVMHPILP